MESYGDQALIAAYCRNAAIALMEFGELYISTYN